MMGKNETVFGLVLVLAFAVVGAAIALIFSKFLDFGEASIIGTTAPAPQPVEGAMVFNPPRPEEAPPDLREAVLFGHNILLNTQQYASDYVGNKLNCTNCHFGAGREKNTISLVGVAAKYPIYRKRQNYAVDLMTRTNDCFQRSMNGKPLPPESKEMTAIITYYQWISKGIPVYADIPWLGLPRLTSDHKADPTTGEQVFADRCAVCHGANGQGTRIAPPLWGPESFNDGAGMSKFDTFAAFVRSFMPKGNPDLAVEEAMDVAAFATAQPRPHFVEKSN